MRCCGVQAKLGLNKFFDLTVDEFTSMYTGTLPEADDQQVVAGSLASGSTRPGPTSSRLSPLRPWSCHCRQGPTDQG